jgi:hypothetical protein
MDDNTKKMLMAVGVGVGATGAIAGAMYFLGGREAPHVPSLSELGKFGKREFYGASAARKLTPAQSRYAAYSPQLSLSLKLEDSTIHAMRHETGKWVGDVTDDLSGKVQPFEMTDEQLGAVLYLGVGGDEVTCADAVYPVAEKAIAGWPRDVRPIP